MKNAKCDIYAAVWSILIKFGSMMNSNHPNLMGYQQFENAKCQTKAILKIEKLWYLHYRFAQWHMLYSTTYSLFFPKNLNK